MLRSPGCKVIDSRKRKPGGRQEAEGQDADHAPTSLFEEKVRGSKGKAKQKMSMAELRQAEASVEKEVVQWYHRVTELWTDMLEGKDEAVREWLLEAEKLVEMFRHTRPLFLTSRVSSNELLSVQLAHIAPQHQGFRGMFPRSWRRTTEASEESMAVRLQLELRESAGHLIMYPTVHITVGRDSSGQVGQNVKGNRMDAFRTIPFDSWLRLFMQVRDPYVALCRSSLHLFLSMRFF